MGIFFRDENDNDDDEYTGPTGDPLHDAVYGWDMESSSSYEDKYEQKTNSENISQPTYSISNDEYLNKLKTFKACSKDELFTITGRKFYKKNIKLTPGMALKLVKEPDNDYDKDAIAVYAENEKIGYVANNDYTRYKSTSSASELQDKIQNTAQGSYLLSFYSFDGEFPIGRIIK